MKENFDLLFWGEIFGDLIFLLNAFDPCVQNISYERALCMNGQKLVKMQIKKVNYTVQYHLNSKLFVV